MTKPEQARLHEDANCHASWCGRVGDWIQLDLGRDVSVASISTQGAKDDFGFVKNYTLSYRTTGGSWVNYEEDGFVKVAKTLDLFNNGAPKLAKTGRPFRYKA